MRDRKNDIDRLTVIDRRSKILNNKFVIPGLESYTPREEPAKKIDTETEEIEQLPIQTGRLSKGLSANFR